MYKGEWARKFVNAVQTEGGTLTLDDLAAYRVNWADPLELSYHQYRLTSLAPPNFGGTTTLVAMNLSSGANLKQFGHYTTSAQGALLVHSNYSIGDNAGESSGAQVQRSIPGN